MKPERSEGTGRLSRTPAEHRAGAPWPTCSCVDCRLARRHEGPETFREILRRIRGQIFEDLRRPESDR